MGRWSLRGHGDCKNEGDILIDDKAVTRLSKREVVEAAVVIGGLVLVQVQFAGISVLLSHLMSLGLNPLTLNVFSALATSILLAPIAIIFERDLWPKKLGLKLMVQFFLISFGGVTMFQTLFIKGIQLTTPAMATAMPNLAPGFIFVIAWAVRLEKVKISCLYSKVKIAGTILCIVGALSMSLMPSTAYKDAPLVLSPSSSPLDNTAFDEQNIVGCLYLIASILVMSGSSVLQASTLGDFPAPISLCAVTSLIGSFMSALFQLFEDHRIDLSSSVMSLTSLVGVSLLAGSVNGLNQSFYGWAMKKRGPVFVSMFSPVSAICTVVISIFTSGKSIQLSSLPGMFLIFTGLYSVLWAKGKEGMPGKDDKVQEDDEFDPEIQKPLLR